MKIVKKLLLILTIIALSFVLFGCVKKAAIDQNPKSTVKPERKYEKLDGIDEDLMVEYVCDNYSIQELAEIRYGDDWGEALVEELLWSFTLSDILKMRYDDYWQYFEDLGIPDVFLFIDELTSQGYADEVEQLRTMADLIGYYPSIIFGHYVADGNRVIHLTNKKCFESIPAGEIISIGPYADIFELQQEISDDDSVLKGYSLCPLCCGNKASSMTDTVEHEDSSQHYESSGITEYSEHEDQGLYDDYSVEDLLEDLKDQIHYYEGLCDFYGYQTYDGVYNPAIWKYYIDSETRIAHNDWLCDDFDHSHNYYLTTQIESSDISECSKCSGIKIVFLDVNTGVFHSEKRKLDLGTDDYINIRVNYRFVSIENALKHGYTYCDCCNYE
jgi:hypothetical protein